MRLDDMPRTLDLHQHLPDHCRSVDSAVGELWGTGTDTGPPAGHCDVPPGDWWPQGRCDDLPRGGWRKVRLGRGPHPHDARTMKEDSAPQAAAAPAQLHDTLWKTRRAYLNLAERTGNAQARRVLRTRLRELRAELRTLGITLRVA